MAITYEKSGVNIDNADATKREIADILNKSGGLVVNKVGAFASLIDVGFLKNYKHPYLVLKTEEPGSKQKLAIDNGKVENICYDMINHLVNDIVVVGATPLTVQDAIICGKIDKDTVSGIVKYISEACTANGCVLTGGETSEQPVVVENGTYILTSSVVGVVEKDDVIDGSKISEGDVVLALASNGIHTNGYSFLRMMMREDKELENTLIDGERFIDVILKPHRSYYKELTPLFKNKNLVGMAHITGGGIAGNLNRILPDNLSAEIDISKIRTLPIFKFIKEKSKADDAELLKTFNMGVGMTVVVKTGSQSEMIEYFSEKGLNSYEIGAVVKGDKTVIYKGKLNFAV